MSDELGAEAARKGFEVSTRTTPGGVYQYILVDLSPTRGVLGFSETLEGLAVVLAGMPELEVRRAQEREADERLNRFLSGRPAST